MASQLRYLTVQDILWINLQTTKQVNGFEYAKLEEATFYQYAYGQSESVLPQAARFLSGFLKMKPLSEGNEATAFIGALSFLELNGYELELDDAHAASWLDDVVTKRKGATLALQIAAKPAHGDGHHHHEPLGIRETIQSVLNRYPTLIA